tara:strand:+ start:222 stop:566 length:345 start_codon:yes stop_codon:yes gene_type:complete
MSDNRKWVPEIVYEDYEEHNLSGGLPFIQVPPDKEMPDIIFILGSEETGDFEPDIDGEEQPIVEMSVNQYANMKYLQEGLSTEVYDQVRQCLNLLPLEEARTRGKEKAENLIKK